jgi:hypothetical protein
MTAWRGAGMKAKKTDSLESAARLIDSISESFGFCAQGGWAVDCGWVGLGRDGVGQRFGLLGA